MKTLKLLLLTVMAVVLPTLGTAQQTTVPHTFQPGTPARASEVNENFSALADAIFVHGLGLEPSAVFAVVAKSGGDYTNPIEAVANISDGDQWCREPDPVGEIQPCLIQILPGIYELTETLVIPTFVSIVGSGPLATVLRSTSSVESSVRIGFNRGGDPEVSLRDLSIENNFGDGTRSVALTLNSDVRAEVSNVHFQASGSSTNIAVEIQEGTNVRFRNVQMRAQGGSRSFGLLDPGFSSFVTVEDSSISASGAQLTNLGVEASEGFRLIRSEVGAGGGQRAIGVRHVTEDGNVLIDGSSISAGGADQNIGFSGFGWNSNTVLVRTDVTVNGSAQSESIAIDLCLCIPHDELRFENIRAIAFHGEGIRIDGGDDLGDFPVEIINSVIGIPTRDFIPGTDVAIRFIDAHSDTDVRIDHSVLVGGIASLLIENFGEETGIKVGGSQLSGPVVLTAGATLKCAGVYDENYDFFPDSCPP